MPESQFPMQISNETDRTKIVIGLVEPKEPFLEPTPDEKAALKIIYAAISDAGIAPSDISLKKISKDYLTIAVDDLFDFCWLKIGPKSKWISLSLWTVDSKVHEDPRLTHVKNKNIRHWKIPLASISDITDLSDLIQLSCLDAKRSSEQYNNS